ncbi:MAG TPA: DUF423 domain-containing protein [Opitutaceae bacterium]|nr:DUF423 domain-containing protein [Opitutaceae bacterium]
MQPPPHRFPLLAAGIFGTAGVALGAMGAHALQPLLTERGMAQVWETGARYHIYHAIALLGLAAFLRSSTSVAEANRLVWAARCWTLGIVLFSGSLYWFAVGGPHGLVYVTPLGGVALLVGWVFVIAAAWCRVTPGSG